MKISRVLLRWYKSFNINYYGYDDRRHGVRQRPWNGLGLDGDSDSYRFIEIPIHNSITTIVGANESGKSHLLSAINKVIRGVGIPDDRKESRFDVTDLCHYASVKDKNAEDWPNIGLEFECDAKELAAVLKATGSSQGGAGNRFTLVPAPERTSDKTADQEEKDSAKQVVAALFVGDQAESIPLKPTTLDAVRKVLPAVEFIRSDIPLSDEVHIDDILAQLQSTGKIGRNWFSFEAAQEAANILQSLSIEANKPIPQDIVSKITAAQTNLRSRSAKASPGNLETKLFSDVLGIRRATFERLAALDDSDRGYAEGIISVWNEELDRILNLSYYWQQDDRFALRVNYKAGVFYFEITDKTGSVYTFRERSSGLRYFLSYYIQAKALEHKYRTGGCVILMDEPDSFLSIAAQKNLLSVFESLVSTGATSKNLQLIYTSHSPFLINKNYPNRIRLVRKGDAEEGTQFIDESRLRHYEPVRSALGIDCAQTLFMGETNVVLEGPSDQFLIAELIRLFAMNREPASFLDLTSLVLMSAESATGVEKLLAASKLSDERIPATVVLFDADDEGAEQQKRVTGVGRRGDRKLIDPKFVLTIKDAIEESCDDQVVVSTEDLIPRSLYAKAIQQFLERWYPDVMADGQKASTINALLQETTFGKTGLVSATEELFAKNVHVGQKKYDKMGVFHEVVSIVEVQIRDSKKAGSELDAVILQLERRLKALCEALWKRIDRSRQECRRDSAAKAVRREILDFFKQFKTSSPAFDIVRILERLTREVKEIGEDGDELRTVLTMLQHVIQQYRDSGKTTVEGEYWKRWSTALWKIKENPVKPEIAKFEELKVDEAVFAKAIGDGQVIDDDKAKGARKA